ncbi:PREDICTED: protein CMSS1 isoform X1 [Chinchilla lanigera]|uniref:protein CMSS1 isoform X1 n=1 Tax=Chinchilla lanigera TaxID=34839 RepID=UPI0006984996|nr:PREDICTED: protein CMSS1 isoform X1 [Chinchilla lanigera]
MIQQETGAVPASPRKPEQPKECFLIQPKEAKEDATKTRKRRKKKITDVLAKSEPKPGTPEDLQKLMKDYYSSNRSVIELEELNLPVCPKWVKLRKNHSEKKSVLMLIICSSAVRALELISPKMKEIPEQPLSRMPDNTAMKQQKLPAHHLRFSAKLVLSIFFGTGAFCLCMGVILILSAKKTKKVEINYTKICANCAEFRENAYNFDKECTCSIPFYLPQKMEGNVYMYYKLYGFYQNLYRYIQSRSNNQLTGEDVRDVENCAPFKVSRDGTPIAPCGAIANSMFNDTIILSYKLNSSVHIRVPMLKNGLTWWTDKYVKFQNPSFNDLPSKFAGSTKPPNWPKPVYELDKSNPDNNGFLNDDFIVWMRTAAFPTFKKLYRRLYRIHHFIQGLPAGNYSFNISYNFPVTRFQGEKAVVLSIPTWCGSGGFFLGIAYTVTGALTWLASFVLMAFHLTWKRKKKEVLQERSQASSRKAENTSGQ